MKNINLISNLKKCGIVPFDISTTLNQALLQFKMGESFAQFLTEKRSDFSLTNTPKIKRKQTIIPNKKHVLI